MLAFRKPWEKQQGSFLDGMRTYNSSSSSLALEKHQRRPKKANRLQRQQSLQRIFGTLGIVASLLTLWMRSSDQLAVGMMNVNEQQQQQLHHATGSRTVADAQSSRRTEAAATTTPLTPSQYVQSLSDEEGFLTERPPIPITIAYAISLIKCSDQHSTPAGLIDAALTLRHSVHLTSSRHNATATHYDYAMFAIVHQQAAPCSHVLRDAGFTILLHDRPLETSEIQDPTLRQNIHRAWCCGHDEFVKLYAYHLTDYPIVVHADMDFLFFSPMDDAFDAMLYSPESTLGRAARERLPVERRRRSADDPPMPRNITAMMTRDWPQVMPGRKAAYQAGLMIAKPDPAVFDIVLDVVRKERYVNGYGRDNGWGGLGYGAFVGAMAMQGLMAFVYDVKLPGTWVELNQCRFNHMGMDVLYRGQPAFNKNHAKVGKCRNDGDFCEDCMDTPISKIHNAHYTMCRKPWACIGEGRSQRNDKKSMEEYMVHVDHCLALQKVWHETRTDLEDKLYALTGDKTILESRKGQYMADIFQGHCTEYSTSGYQRISGLDASFRRVPELYEKDASVRVAL